MLEVYIIGSACATIAGTLLYKRYKTRKKFFDSLYDLIDKNSGSVDAKKLTYREAFPSRGPTDGIDAGAIIESILAETSGYQPSMSNVFEFKIDLENTNLSNIVFRYCPEEKRFVKGSVTVNNMKVKTSEKINKQLGEIGLEAHVMWKMSQNL